MSVYLCKLFHGSEHCGVVTGENAADAVLKYATYDAACQYEEMEAVGGSINAYCEVLLNQYEVTELYRAMVLEYVERRLDGDTSITILL